MNLDEFLEEYAKAYAFETELRWTNLYPAVGEDCRKRSKAIAINIGMSNSQVFDSVWRKECPPCHGKGGILWNELGESSERCEGCKGKGYIEPYDLMITFCRRPDKLWNVSLYSPKDDIDCGEIAKSFGGGDHKRAAGFQCKELPFEI